VCHCASLYRLGHRDCAAGALRDLHPLDDSSDPPAVSASPARNHPIAPPLPSMTEQERQQKLEQLAACEKFGEEAYDQMYEERSSSGDTACYSEVKESFYEAIRVARELGLAEKEQALEERLSHIKAVFRSQFT